MKNIAFVGSACSGKTAATFIAFVRDCHLIKFAAPLYGMNFVLKITKNRKYMQESSDLVKKHFGDDFFVKYFFSRVTPDTYHICDDLRYEMEFNALQEAGWVIVYIDASEEVCRQRAIGLDLEFSPDHPSETSVFPLKDRCDYIIKNNGTMGDFEKAVLDIITKIGN